jgi:hypothetical protein
MFFHQKSYLNLTQDKQKNCPNKKTITFGPNLTSRHTKKLAKSKAKTDFSLSLTPRINTIWKDEKRLIKRSQ